MSAAELDRWTLVMWVFCALTVFVIPFTAFFGFAALLADIPLVAVWAFAAFKVFAGSR